MAFIQQCINEIVGFLNGINLRITNNQLMTSEAKMDIRKYIHEQVDLVFDAYEYELDFYAKPVYLKKQIERFCKKLSICEEVTKLIAECLVDDNGRNGRDPEYIFQRPGDIHSKLDKAIGFWANEELVRFWEQIDRVKDHKINWNKRFNNVINHFGDSYPQRKNIIEMNLTHFFVTYKLDLSVVKPCIKTKEDFLPPVFALMEAGDSYVLRRYRYENKDEHFWLKRFSVDNLECNMNYPGNVLSDMHLFPNRNVEKRTNFILNQLNIIYMLEIFFPTYECMGTIGPDNPLQIMRYVGQASTGLLERWCKTATCHLKDIYNVWLEMQMWQWDVNCGNRMLSGSLVHCAVPYAHVMGYKTELYIVDQVSYDVQKRWNSRIAIAGQGRQTRSLMASDEYLPDEFVEWYKACKPGKPKLLDVFEQWWINKMQSTADKWGFNYPSQRNLEVHHFYNLAIWDGSQNYPVFDIQGIKMIYT